MTSIEQPQLGTDAPDMVLVRSFDECDVTAEAHDPSWRWYRKGTIAGVLGGLVIGGLFARERYLSSHPFVLATSPFISSAVPEPQREALARSSTVVDVKLPGAAEPEEKKTEGAIPSKADVERLETRNRRLEALIQVLRQREGSVTRSSSTPEN